MMADVLALTPEQLEISPGVGAFTAFFVLAIAMVLLVLNMSKHLRRVDRHRIEAEVRAEFEEEQAAKRRESEGPDGEDEGRTGTEAAPETENGEG